MLGFQWDGVLADPLPRNSHASTLSLASMRLKSDLAYSSTVISVSNRCNTRLPVNS